MGKGAVKKSGLGERIAKARDAAGLSQAALGKPIGVTRSAVSQWESEGTEPTPENLRAIALETDVNFDWLATGRGAMGAELSSEDVAYDPQRPGRRMVKVKGYVGAGGAAHYYAVAQGDLDEIPASDQDPKNAVAVQVIGSSMGKLLEGWYVIYDDVRRPVTADLNGQLCVVGLPDDRILVKRIRAVGKGLYDLISETEEPIRNVKIDWAAKVAAFRSR